MYDASVRSRTTYSRCDFSVSYASKNACRHIGGPGAHSSQVKSSQVKSSQVKSSRWFEAAPRKYRKPPFSNAAPDERERKSEVTRDAASTWLATGLGVVVSAPARRSQRRSAANAATARAAEAYEVVAYEVVAAEEAAE